MADQRGDITDAAGKVFRVVVVDAEQATGAARQVADAQRPVGAVGSDNTPIREVVARAISEGVKSAAVASGAAGPPVAGRMGTAYPVAPSTARYTSAAGSDDPDMQADLERQAADARARDAGRKAAADAASDAEWQARKQANDDRWKARHERREEEERRGKEEAEKRSKGGQQFDWGLAGGMRQMQGGNTQGMAQAAGQMAGSGMLGSGALASGAASLAGGPIPALVDAAVTMATNRAADARKDIEAVGQAARQLAGNDGFGMLNTAVDRASDKLASVPVVGKLLSEQLQGAVAPLREFTKTVDAYNERGRHLAQYSGGIANAAAQSDVAAIQRDMREAARMSGTYSRLAERQTELDNAMAEALLPIKEQVGELLATGVPVLTMLVNGLAPFFETHARMLEALNIVALWATNHHQEAADKMAEFGNDEGRKFDHEIALGKMAREFDGWLLRLDNMRPRPVPEDPRMAEFNRRANGPLAAP